MANINPKRFQANSMFPMPAQTDSATVTINVPSGTETGGAGYANTLTADFSLPSNTSYIRVNILSSRRSIRFVGSPLVMYENDATFIAFISARGNGNFRATVMLTSGFDAPFTTSSVNNFTFNVTGFRVP